MANTFKFGNGNWAVKDGYALAYNDENNNFKPLPFDFTRASSATRVNKQGIIETVGSGKPRIDFTDNTSGHLLLEPSRSNYLTYSNDISGYSNFGSTDSANSAISPDGSQNASLVQGDGSQIQVFLASQFITLPSAGFYTISMFAKKGNNNFAQLSVDAFTGATNTTAYFDLENGTTPTSGASIENYGNGWYKCSTVVTIDSGDLNGRIAFRVVPSSSSFLFSSTSAASGKNVYVYGFQMEAGSYATSYIPTEGSSVMRVAEAANGAGNSTVFNDSEGVLFAEVAALANDSTTRVITINDTSNQLTERVQLFILGTSMYGRVTDGGVTQGQVIGTPTLTDNNKIAFKYKANDFALWINGVEVDTSNSGSTPSGLDTIRFDAGTGGSDFYGRIKDLRVYNTALSDSELQALTS